MPAYWQPGPYYLLAGPPRGGFAPCALPQCHPAAWRAPGVPLGHAASREHHRARRACPLQITSISVNLLLPTHTSASCPSHIHTAIGPNHAPLSADATRRQPSCPRLYAAWLYAVNMQPRALSNRHHAADATIGSYGSALQSITTKECLRSARYAAAGRTTSRGRNTFNRCLLLLSKFHYSHDTPPHGLDTRHIFSGACMG